MATTCPEIAKQDDSKIVLSTYNRTVGTTVAIDCKGFGQQVSDPTNVVCLPTGKWSENPNLSCKFGLSEREKMILGVAISCGALVLLVVITLCCYCCCCRRRRRERYYQRHYYDKHQYHNRHYNTGWRERIFHNIPFFGGISGKEGNHEAKNWSAVDSVRRENTFFDRSRRNSDIKSPAFFRRSRHASDDDKPIISDKYSDKYGSRKNETFVGKNTIEDRGIVEKHQMFTGEERNFAKHDGVVGNTFYTGMYTHSNQPQRYTQDYALARWKDRFSDQFQSYGGVRRNQNTFESGFIGSENRELTRHRRYSGDYALPREEYFSSRRYSDPTEFVHGSRRNYGSVVEADAVPPRHDYFTSRHIDVNGGHRLNLVGPPIVYTEPVIYAEPRYMKEIIEATPQVIERQPRYIESSTQYINTKPRYIESAPRYIDSAPRYVESRPKAALEVIPYGKTTNYRYSTKEPLLDVNSLLRGSTYDNYITYDSRRHMKDSRAELPGVKIIELDDSVRPSGGLSATRGAHYEVTTVKPSTSTSYFVGRQDYPYDSLMRKGRPMVNTVESKTEFYQGKGKPTTILEDLAK